MLFALKSHQKAKKRPLYRAQWLSNRLASFTQESYPAWQRCSCKLCTQPGGCFKTWNRPAAAPKILKLLKESFVHPLVGDLMVYTDAWWGMNFVGVLLVEQCWICQFLPFSRVVKCQPKDWLQKGHKGLVGQQNIVALGATWSVLRCLKVVA